jgi:hypothetical protein
MEKQTAMLRSWIQQMNQETGAEEMWLSQIFQRALDQVPGGPDVDVPAALQQLASRGEVEILETAKRPFRTWWGETFQEDIRFKVNKPPSGIGSGGVTITQSTTGANSPIINSPITVGVVPRRMSAQDIIAITRFLSEARVKARIRITADQNSNLVGLADDFYKVFKDAGWQMADAGVDQFIGLGPPGKRFAGVIVTWKGAPVGPGETVFVTSDDPVFYLAQIVDAFKLPHILKRVPNEQDNVITIQFEGTLE